MSYLINMNIVKDMRTSNNIENYGDYVKCNMCDALIIIDKCEEVCPVCNQKGYLTNLEDENGNIIDFDDCELEF